MPVILQTADHGIFWNDAAKASRLSTIASRENRSEAESPLDRSPAGIVGYVSLS